MNAGVLSAPDDPGDYEANQGWPSEVTAKVARHFLSALGPGAARCLVLGCATGVNDALPLARVLPRGGRVLAGDVERPFLRRLRERAAREGLANVEVRRIDVTEDLTRLGTFQVVSLLFVIHRLGAWEAALDRLCLRVAPGGSFFISEFAGPGGVIYRSNERGGRGRDPVSRLIRRYFELLPDRFEPPLRSSSIGPVLRRLEGSLVPRGHEDFAWDQAITAREMLDRIRRRAYAPYFCTDPHPELLERMESEFLRELDHPIVLRETIRIHRFERPGR